MTPDSTQKMSHMRREKKKSRISRENSVHQTPSMPGDAVATLDRASEARSHLRTLSSHPLGEPGRKLRLERAMLGPKAHSKVGCSCSQNLEPLHPGS